MKRTLLLALCGLFSLGIGATQRSAQEAQQLAADYLQQSSFRAPAKEQATLSHCYTAPKTNGTPAFYVFNYGTDNGYVIVSAESRTHTILGYSTIGHFDEAEIPDNMRAWLEGYQEAISFAASLPERPSQPDHLRRATKTYTPIAPLCTTKWGQGSPFNSLCPDDNGKNGVTGCVATAASQIMKKHNYPATGKGSNGYYWHRSEDDSVYLYADFENTTYDWSNMQDTCTSSSTDVQKNAVAQLMYHCGVACNMKYSANGSGASSPTMINRLVVNFRYNAGIKTLCKDYMKEEVFLNGIIADLQAGRPVYFSGRTKSDSGHAFVCDGLDADGLIHINWGWTGKQDNYFRVSALDPKDQGTGGSAGNEAFTERVTAYTHIMPVEGGLYQPTITADSLYIEGGNRLGREDNVCFHFVKFKSQSLHRWEGSPVFLVYKNDSLYKTCPIDLNLTLTGNGYYYGYVNACPYLADLPAGEYEIVPAAVNTDVEMDTMPTPVMVRYIGECRCAMTVTSDSIFLTMPEEERPVVIEPDIPDPTTYTYKYLDAKYYPEEAEGAEFWQLQLATEGFYKEDSTDQMCILIGITSSSPEAIVGSYLSDKTALYHCAYAYMYTGNISSYTGYSVDKCDLTMVYRSNTDSYIVHYRFVIGSKTFVGQTEVAVAEMRDKYGEAYGDHKKGEKITLDHTRYTALTTTQAMQMIEANSVGWSSPIPYVVKGEISELKNTPAQMVAYKNCRLFISDGTTPLYAYNTKWLNNTDFSTGNEIAVGGQAVIAGCLKYYNASTKEIQEGYFCYYEAPTEEKLEDVTGTEPSVQKVIRNGQIFIIRNGETYTVVGERL